MSGDRVIVYNSRDKNSEDLERLFVSSFRIAAFNFNCGIKKDRALRKILIAKLVEKNCALFSLMQIIVLYLFKNTIIKKVI